MADDDDDVGYGRPPKHSRFKKGQSGNPRGRPKGSPNLSTAIANVMKSKVPVHKANRTLLMPATMALAQKLFQLALKGNFNAVKGLVVYGHLDDAFAECVQRTSPFAPEDLEILREALGEPADETDKDGGDQS